MSLTMGTASEIKRTPRNKHGDKPGHFPTPRREVRNSEATANRTIVSGGIRMYNWYALGADGSSKHNRKLRSRDGQILRDDRDARPNLQPKRFVGTVKHVVSGKAVTFR